jgi:hypothetical protein
MRFTVTKILGVLLTGVVLLIPSHGLAQGQSQADQTSEAKQESSPPTPDLADFVPLAAALTGRLTTLEKELAGLLDISSVDKKYDGIEVTKITIMLSALGVGVGFGLRNVVNNFVSGLILLFERPVRVGDLIEIGGYLSEAVLTSQLAH